MAELYKGIAGSPITQLVGDITDTQVTIAIADDSALPDAPNICTIGYGEHIETIKYEAKSNGVLQNVTRGIEGTPRAWPSGTEVARFFTAHDHNAIIAELEDARAELEDARLSDVKEKTFDTLKERLEESEGEHQTHLADYESHKIRTKDITGTTSSNGNLQSSVVNLSASNNTVISAIAHNATCVPYVTGTWGWGVKILNNNTFEPVADTEITVKIFYVNTD